MCLLIEILMPDVAAVDAGSLAREAAALGLLQLSAQKQSRASVGTRFLLSEPQQGCACSLLAENADWDSAYYALDPARLATLEATLVFLAARAGSSGFALRAAWLDGTFQDAGAASARPAALAELLADVRGARIGNNVRYEVSEGHA